MEFYIVLLVIILIIAIFQPNEEYQNFYLGQPTKCFDCENQLPDNLKYLGGPTKCFSCERELSKRYGHVYADLAQPTKCFDCESQMGQKPF